MLTDELMTKLVAGGGQVRSYSGLYVVVRPMGMLCICTCMRRGGWCKGAGETMLLAGVAALVVLNRDGPSCLGHQLHISVGLAHAQVFDQWHSFLPGNM